MAVAAPGIRARARRPAIARPTVRWGVVAILLVWPWVLPAQPFASAAVSAAISVLALMSLVVLTGWIGQISLAQAGIMGVGAFTAAQITNHLSLDFPLNTVVAGTASAAVAVVIGLPALRIKGLYLAIATLAFQWMLQQSLLQAHWFSGGFNGVRIPTPAIGNIRLDDERLLYYVAWPITILVFLLIANLRDSKTGRAWFAIRGSEIAARTMGINVTSYKLLGFAVSGFVLGVAGSIKLNFVGSATPLEYYFNFSILFLAVAVLAGIGSLAGALGFGIFYTLLNDWIFGDYLTPIAGWVPAIAAVLLITTILQNPGGVAAVREKIHEDRLVRQARKRMRAGLRAEEHASVTVEAEPVEQVAARLATRLEARGERTARLDTPVLLGADGITIRFGGVVANDGVHLEVRNGEITGLIGPNGAGKTTFFNAVSGIIEPNEGTISFAGTDITKAPAHARAALGMGRTFQIMRLFPRLTVFENVMIGTHLQNPAGTVSNLLQLRSTRMNDARLRDRVRETLAFLGIERLADQRVAGMPFGILRLVELARAVVASPKLLLLDEPASGLDVSETDAFAEHLFRIREEMGQTILLIEHDMRLVMMVSDYVYVLEFGRNLAEGVPSEVQGNEAVIAAYLGQEAGAEEAHVG